MQTFSKLSPQKNDLAFIELPIPEISENELLIKVQAIGVGIHDEYFLPQGIVYPYPIGIEASGVIEKVGGKVTGFQSGQRVSFISSMQIKGGTWAEYVAVVDTALIVPIPDTMSFENAAAIPVAGSTILRAFSTLELKPGNTLFIAGGSGAIGTFAIQIAKQKGFEIVASASKKNHAYMKELGATKTVDYHDDDWQAQVLQEYPEGLDATIAIQPGTSKDSEPVVKDGGTIVTISGDQDILERGIELKQLPYDVDVTEELAELYSRISSGEMTLQIEEIYPFAKAMKALEKVQTRHVRGKVVVTLNYE